MPNATADDLLCQTIAVQEALDQASSSLGLGPAPISLAAVKFAARITAHIDVTEAEFVEQCRAAFRATRQQMSVEVDLARTCPSGFLRTMLRSGAAREVAAPRAPPKLRLVRNS